MLLYGSSGFVGHHPNAVGYMAIPMVKLFELLHAFFWSFCFWASNLHSTITIQCSELTSEQYRYHHVMHENVSLSPIERFRGGACGMTLRNLTFRLSFVLFRLPSLSSLRPYLPSSYLPLVGCLYSSSKLINRRFLMRSYGACTITRERAKECSS